MSVIKRLNVNKFTSEEDNPKLVALKLGVRHMAQVGFV